MSKELKHIQLAKKGDKTAFSKLVKMHKNYVFSLIMNILKNREDAEDVLQNTFLKIYRKLNTFKGDSKFTTWIYKIAVNEALAHKRLYKFKYAIENKSEPVTNKNAQTKLELNERSNLIKQAIEKLSETEQLVISLFYLKEHKVKEIANICANSEGWVKINLFRARNKLKEILKNKNLSYGEG